MYHKNLPAFLFPDAAPAADAGPHCPICGEAADTLFYIDRWGDDRRLRRVRFIRHPRTPAAFPPPDSTPAARAARPVKRKGGPSHEKKAFDIDDARCVERCGTFPPWQSAQRAVMSARTAPCAGTGAAVAPPRRTGLRAFGFAIFENCRARQHCGTMLIHCPSGFGRVVFIQIIPIFVDICLKTYRIGYFVEFYSMILLLTEKERLPYGS